MSTLTEFSASPIYRLCLGTERKPTSVTAEARTPDGASYTPPLTSLEGARLTRLLQLTRLLELTQEATNIRLEDAQSFDPFFKETFTVLARLTGLHRRMTPLPSAVFSCLLPSPIISRINALQSYAHMRASLSTSWSSTPTAAGCWCSYTSPESCDAYTTARTPTYHGTTSATTVFPLLWNGSERRPSPPKQSSINCSLARIPQL